MVRTATGLIKRAVGKLAVLPIDSEIVGTLPLPTGGVCTTAPAALFAYRCRLRSYTTKAVAYLFSNYFVSLHMSI